MKLRKLDSYDEYVRLQNGRSHADTCNCSYKEVKELTDDTSDIILDVGCRNAFIVHSFFNDGYKNVFGIDIGENAQNLWYRKFQKNFVDDHLKLTDIHNGIPYDQKFNLIIMSHVMEHLYDVPMVLDKVKQSLKSNGKLYIIVPIEDNMDHKPHYTIFEKQDDLKILMEDNGFETIAIETSNGEIRGTFIPKSKKLIYMVAIDHDSSTNKASDYAQYAIQSWKTWCEKNNIDFSVNSQHDVRFGKPIWNKELIYEHGKEYDKIGIVDCDTMIHPNAPNIFNLYDKEFCGVVDTADFNWILNSIEAYSKFFPNININVDEYFNAGVLFMCNNHLNIFKQVLDFYLENKEELDNWNKGGGKEQTILNYHLVKNDVEKKLLTPKWNLFPIHKRDMFKHNWQLKKDQIPFYIKHAYVWHFTGFEVSKRAEVMKGTLNLIGGQQ